MPHDNLTSLISALRESKHLPERVINDLERIGLDYGAGMAFWVSALIEFSIDDHQRKQEQAK